jgi:hypothetical protein
VGERVQGSYGREEVNPARNAIGAVEIMTKSRRGTMFRRIPVCDPGGGRTYGGGFDAVAAAVGTVCTRADGPCAATPVHDERSLAQIHRRRDHIEAKNFNLVH